jgi:sorting nexin-25
MMAVPISTSMGLCALVLALASYTPMYNLVQPLTLLPQWISLTIVALLIWGTCVLLRAKRKLSPSHTRRYGLLALAFTTPSAWSAVLTKHKWEESSSSGVQHQSRGTEGLNERLDAVFELIRTSFILPWYNRISPSSSFPNAVDDLIHQSLSELVNRSEQADWSSILVSKIVPTLTDHLRHFRSVEHLSSTGPSPNAALPLPLPHKSHSALSQQAQVSGKTPLASVETHFRAVLERVVRELIPENDRSEVVSTMVREVLLGTVFLPVFEMLCDSDFWNRQIDEKGGRYLHEQCVIDRKHH